MLKDDNWLAETEQATDAKISMHIIIKFIFVRLACLHRLVGYVFIICIDICSASMLFIL